VGGGEDLALSARRSVRDVTILRMDHVGVVVDNLEAAIAFFVELGMELDGGATPVEGDWVDPVVGLDMRFESRSRSCGRPTVRADSS
jgi:catechol 2,3-dioxygenase-like lactoylglutathione lyase family enzyme